MDHPDKSDPARDRATVDAIVVGAGPAGLAVAACLKQAGASCLILEQADRVGASWHRHYDRLHLHTDKARSQLPLMGFAPEVPRYPSRDQFIEYLEHYARRFELQPRFGERLMCALHGGDMWEARTQDGRHLAPNVVIATGYSRVPHAADWPSLSAFRGQVLHSSAYRNGQPFKGRKVLVVGLGNSGGEIAIDLHEHGAEASLSLRGPVNVIPRELFGIPILAFAIFQSRLPARLADRLNRPIQQALIGDLRRYGLQRPQRGPLEQIHEAGRIPLIDVGTVDLIKRGSIKVFPAISRFSENDVHFSDGRRHCFDSIILATGYRPRVDQLVAGASAAIDPAGDPIAGGRRSLPPGLYFCGFRVVATGMLREIALEAERIAASIYPGASKVSNARDWFSRARSPRRPGRS